ncbi:uncharacterized protein LOC129755497 [Uranotaenia lowii]|uniref:uncharacterized protein LOC129755497 n=1 Tax=Uranotaenia lowii TaxID=190385 RepID=UPI00247A61C9|nr:uncharacterized protein LOC129755497 [Uranotaenia lowii]
MDADKLNRELHIFRNHVKIARENIIHKLVRDVRFWSAKVKDGSNPRAARKLASLEPLIPHIRTQPASQLAKAIIRFNAKKSSTGNSSLEDRALSRFFEHKKLQPEVRALIRRFGLSSKMEVLDKYLKNSSGDQAKKKSKKKKGRSNKGKGKESVKAKSKKVDQESDDQGFCEGDEPGKPKEDEESMEIEENISEASDNESENGAGKFVKVTPAKNKPNKKLKNQEASKKQKKKLAANSPEDEHDEEKIIQIQDSFFVTSSGQSYVATAPALDKNSEQEKVEEEYDWKRSNKRKNISGNDTRTSTKKTSDTDMHPSWKAKQQQKGLKPFEGNRKVFGDDGSKSQSSKRVKTDPHPEDIHPSWAAKQKQRSIQPFAGKKINFESNESDAACFPKQSATVEPFKVKSKSINDTDSRLEDLHPSWAAKQKQKGLQPFKGKKIVFDSIGGGESSSSNVKQHISSPAEVPSDLHPSWLAKQKEKGIQEFRGKKITFGDD